MAIRHIMRAVEAKRKQTKSAMKKSIKLALLAAVGVALTSLPALAQSDVGGQAPAQPPGGPPHAPPRLEQLLTHLLEKYDVNKDGVLDQTELAALRQDIAD